MQLALGLAAVLLGADLAIAGITNRSFTRLLTGNWDAPSAATPTVTTPPGTSAPKTAVTGGVHGQSGASLTSFLHGINQR